MAAGVEGPWVAGPAACRCGRSRRRLRSALLLVAVGAVLPWSVQTGWAAWGDIAEDRVAHHGGGARPDDGLVAADPGRLLPELVDAFQRAHAAAAADGVELVITSGYRTPERQQQLFDEAVAEYGSSEEARQWVLPPGESNHVRGSAIDVGPVAAADWLQQRGAAFGLCQTYINEWWHFEHRPEWEQHGRCPPPSSYPG